MAGADLHIVAFAVPFPPDYGGAIDVWNRICALHKEGVKIKLHCFVYSDFKPQDAIMDVTNEAHYYRRIKWPALLSPGQPYIVASRRNPLLLAKLKLDHVPILFEGIHTTGFASGLKDRKKMLRAHNIEHQYYSDLAKTCKGFHYLFFEREALALERYEDDIASSVDEIYTISSSDDRWYQQKGARSVFMPVFHGFDRPEGIEGRGKYLLYQGDLSIEMNQKALVDLLKNIPSEPGYPIVVAGKSGQSTFEEKLMKYPNLRREINVSSQEMSELIRDAQIVLVHSVNPAGMKVKIFPALFQGRFVVANDLSRTNTSIDQTLNIYSSFPDLAAMLKKLWPIEFSRTQSEERKVILSQIPTDQEKVQAIIRNL